MTESDGHAGAHDERGYSRLESLTGFRFIAALMVFLFHTALLINPIRPTEPAINPFANTAVAHTYAFATATAGFVGVSCFFVLSGFVLAWSTTRELSARAFIRRRLVKIFPTHVVTWAIAMVLIVGGTASWHVWLPNLLLLQSWSPDLQVSQSVNMPSWSLACELLFYVTLPIFARPIGRLSVRGLWAGAFAMVFGLALYQFIIATFVPSEPTINGAPLSNLQYWLAYLMPLGRMFEFVLGAFLAHLVWRRAWIHVPLSAAALLFIIGYGASLVVPPPYGINLMTILPIGVLVASLATADVTGRRNWLRAPTLVWFGKISFGFYMAQAITIFWVRSVTGSQAFSTPVALLVILALFAITLAAGWCLHQFVEAPMMRRFSRRRHAGSSSTTHQSQPQPQK